MKKINSFRKMKAICIAIGLVTVFSASAEVPAFDSDKPVTSFSPSYSQVFNTWDGTVFYNQWDMTYTPFDATDIAAGYLQFVWDAKRIIRSKSTYGTPYVFSAVLDWSQGFYGGIIVRAKATGAMDALQEPAISDPGFNREGIAFYPTADGQNMVVQFSGVDNGYGLTALTKINVAKPAGVSSLLNDQGTMRIEDFGTSLYIYYRGARYIRIDLGGLTGGVYTSGTVYNSDMTSVGTFTGMEVETAGKVAIAQRGANISLYSAEVKTVPVTSAFDSDKPATSFTTSYSQAFNTTWDGTVFYNQWDMTYTPFDATDIAAGYLQFVWDAKRIIRSKSTYGTPYVFSTVVDWSAGPSTNGGIIVRAKATGNLDALQEPAISDPGFNREGIAFYPSDDGQNMIVQFSGVDNGYSLTTLTKINVAKPAGVTSLLNDQGAIRIEDFGTTLYVYYRGARYIRIDLGGLTGGVYTSGTVYNSDMTSVGTFTGMEVETAGKVAFAQRNSNLRLYSAEIKIKDIGTNVNNVGSTFNTYQSGVSIVVDLNGLNGQQTVSVYDVQGKSLLTRRANGGEKLSISNDLKTGVYFIKVQGLEKTMMTKLIVK